jgi:hypothetical protein
MLENIKNIEMTISDNALKGPGKSELNNIKIVRKNISER